MNLLESIKTQRLFEIGLVIIVNITLTWLVVHQFAVKPRDVEITRLQHRLTDVEQHARRQAALIKQYQRARSHIAYDLATGSVSTNGQTASPTPEDAAPAYGDVLNKQNPYPIGLDLTHVGALFADLKAKHPAGNESDVTLYIVPHVTGPFLGMRYIQRDGKADIQAIDIFFRDTAASEYVKAQALSAFGTDTLESKAFGSVLEWRDVNGVMVTIDSRIYRITQAIRQPTQ